MYVAIAVSLLGAWKMSVTTSLNTADLLLAPTTGKANFDRIARLLVCGGKDLLREVFDSIHPPSMLPVVLNHPLTKSQLYWLNQQEQKRLYPSPGAYGKSVEFDITLLYKLLKTICNLPTPAHTGWNNCPNPSDRSLSADLARIRFYRNEICHSINNMEIDDANFLFYWGEISGAIVRMAKSISADKEHEWKTAIDKFLKDPLTPDDDRNIQELSAWYYQDVEVKKEVEGLKREFQDMKMSVDTLSSAGMICLKLGLY